MQGSRLCVRGEGNCANVEQIISAIQHSVASTWFSFLHLYRTLFSVDFRPQDHHYNSVCSVIYKECFRVLGCNVWGLKMALRGFCLTVLKATSCTLAPILPKATMKIFVPMAEILRTMVVPSSPAESYKFTPASFLVIHSRCRGDSAQGNCAHGLFSCIL